MNVKACPDDKYLAAHLLGRLHGARAEQLDSHLQVCDSCVERANKLRPKDKLTSALGGDVVDMSGDESVVLDIIEKAGALHSIVETSTGYETSSGQSSSGSSSASDISFLSPSLESDEIGRLGHYRVLEILGAGGMGVVFRAEDSRLKRQVALKAMKPEIAATASAKERFLREARATAAIEHDNIVTIHQVDEEGGIPFLAMRFLRGESLQTRLKREEKLSIQEILRIGREVASGLSAAHGRGLIHRDIKPDNIWLETRHPQPSGEDRGEDLPPQTSLKKTASKDRVKIVDFGLARADDDINLTKTGTVMGTPRYMSPEQAQGQTVDYRSDLFSLGAVLYHLTTGEGPFDRGNLTATLLAVMNDDPDRIESHRDDVPKQLADLIWQLLEKDPDNRPQSAEEVVEAIAEIEQLPIDKAMTRAKHKPKVKSEVKPRTREQTKSRGRVDRRRLLIGCAVVIPLISVFGIVLLVRMPEGTLRVEVNDDNLEVLIDGDAITMNDKAWEGKRKARKHGLSLKLNGKEIPFDEESQAFVADKGRISIRLGEIELKAKQFEVSRSGTTVLRIGFVPDEASVAIVPLESNPDETDKREEPKISPTASKPQLVAQIEHDAGKTKNSYFASLSPDGMRVAHRMSHAVPMQMIDVRTNQEISLPKEMQFALAMDYNSDGTLFATGHPDGTVRVWNSQTLAQVGQPFVTKSGEQVRWVSLSGDGARLLALSNEKPPTLYAWYANSREKVVDPIPLEDFSWKTKEIRLAATSDGRSFAIASFASAIPKLERRADGPDQVDESETLIQLWDVESGSALDTKFVPSNGVFGAINGIDISPRGDRLALACKRGQSYVYDTASGKEIWSAEYGGRVIAVRFSPDGRQLASCGGAADSEDMHLWDAATGKELTRWHVPADEESGRTEWFGAWASKLAFSGDGSRLLTAGVNTPVCVWTMNERKSTAGTAEQTQNPVPEELHPEFLNEWPHAAVDIKDSRFALLSPDGARVAFRMGDVPLQIVHSDSKQEIGVPGEMQDAISMAYSSDGRLIATGHSDRKIRLWNADSLASMGEPFESSTEPYITWVFLSADGTKLIAMASRSLVKIKGLATFFVWDTTTRKLISRFEAETNELHQGSIIDASVNGRLVAIAGRSRVTLWDTSTGNQSPIQFAIPEIVAKISGLDLSEDGMRLAYGAMNGAPSLAILDTSNGQELWQSPKQNGRVYAVRFSPDGEWLASTVACENECRLSLWDAKTGTEITRWQQEYDAQVEHGNWIKFLSFSQDNSRLLSAGIATPIRLWRLKENRTEVLGK